MSPGSTRVRVEVDGRIIVLSNLEKVLYPTLGFTKGEIIDYYTRISAVLLPHVVGRPLTRKRWPDGVAGEAFFEKNSPRGTPSWVRTARLPSPGSSRGSETVDYVVVDDLPTVVWLANLAALELHVPQWRIDADGVAKDPDLLVFDLDPGAPAGLTECVEVAFMLREALAADGLTAWLKTSGSKGMQLYVPLPETPGDRTAGYAKRLAGQLARAHPKLVTAEMTRARRPGKVFIDWSQNNPAKTTVAPYSLRGRDRPTVSTPLRWDELDDPEELVFEPDAVLERVAEHGDLFAGLTSDDPDLRRPLPEPGPVEQSADDPRAGGNK